MEVVVGKIEKVNVLNFLFLQRGYFRLQCVDPGAEV